MRASATFSSLSISQQTGAPQLFALAVQTDGKVIIGGAFDQVAGQPRMEIARLEADGTLDPSFTSPFEMTSLGVTVRTLGLDGSGGTFVGGSFMVGGSLETLVKLKADGSVDDAFVEAPALRFSQVAKVLVSGDKLYVATVGSGGLDRLDANGSFDPTFTHFSDASSQNLDFALQPSGSLIVGLDDAVVRIGSDGKLARWRPAFRSRTSETWCVACRLGLPSLSTLKVERPIERNHQSFRAKRRQPSPPRSRPSTFGRSSWAVQWSEVPAKRAPAALAPTS